MVLVTVAVVTSVLPGVGAAPPTESPAHFGPGNQRPLYYVSAVIDEVVIELPVPDMRDERLARDAAADRLYYDFLYKDEPDYLVVVRFEHESHHQIVGGAWLTDYDHKDDSGVFRAGGTVKATQTLYDAAGGMGDPDHVNEFDRWDDGSKTPARAGVTGIDSVRFLIGPHNGYAHLHCAPLQDMEVVVAVVELDDGTGAEVASILFGSMTSIGIGLATGPGAIATVAGTVVSTAVSFGVGQIDNDHDVIGHGRGTLDPNGRTEIDIVYRDWVEASPGDHSDNPAPWEPGETVPESTGFIGATVTKLGYDTETFRPYPTRFLVEEKRGHVAFETQTIPVEELVDDAYGTWWPPVDYDRRNDAPCWGETGAGVPPGTPTETDDGDGPLGYDYRTDLKGALAFAAVVGDMSVDANELPPVARDYSLKQRINVEVGATTLGVGVGADGRTDRVVAGGFDNPTIAATMSAATARELSSAADPKALVWEKLGTGEITYRGVGLGNAVPISGYKLAVGTGELVDRKLVGRFPTSYDIPVGRTRTITLEGESVELTRNRLGYRTLRRDGNRVAVVDRRGQQYGMSTVGTQRLLASPPPGNWTTVTERNAGVYTVGRGGGL